MTANQIKEIERDGARQGLLALAGMKLFEAKKRCEDAQKDQWRNCETELAKARECIDDAEQMVLRANELCEILER